MKNYIRSIFFAITWMIVSGTSAEPVRILIDSVIYDAMSVRLSGVVSFERGTTEGVWDSVTGTDLELEFIALDFDTNPIYAFQTIGTVKPGDYATLGEVIKNSSLDNGHYARFSVTFPGANLEDSMAISLRSNSRTVLELANMTISGLRPPDCYWKSISDVHHDFGNVTFKLDKIGSSTQISTSSEMTCNATTTVSIKTIQPEFKINDSLSAKVTFNGMEELVVTGYNTMPPITIETTLTRTAFNANDTGDFEGWTVILVEYP